MVWFQYNIQCSIVVLCYVHALCSLVLLNLHSLLLWYSVMCVFANFITYCACADESLSLSIKKRKHNYIQFDLWPCGSKWIGLIIIFSLQSTIAHTCRLMSVKERVLILKTLNRSIYLRPRPIYPTPGSRHFHKFETIFFFFWGGGECFYFCARFNDLIYSYKFSLKYVVWHFSYE
jgi:hypothetical protein